MKSKKKRLLLGFGIDHNDGHIRVTKGDNFYLAGGSPDMHNSMREKALSFNAALKKNGNSLEDTSYDEIIAIARNVGFKHFKTLSRHD